MAWPHASAAPNSQIEAGTPLNGSVHEVRTILPSEWGIPYPAGLSYSLVRDQLILLNKQRGTPPSPIGNNALVVITPYEDLVASVALSLTLESGINMAYDDGVGELLLLDSQQDKLIRIPLTTEGRPDSAALLRADIAHLGLVVPSGMAVDHVGRQLYILDSGTAELARVNLDEQLTLVTKIALSQLGASTLRGLARHPLSNNLFMVDPVQGLLHEVNPNGDPVRNYDLSELALVDPGGIAFGPSTDLTDDPQIFHLFMVDSNVPDELPTATAANRVWAAGSGFCATLSLRPVIGTAPGCRRSRTDLSRAGGRQQ